MWGGGGVVGEVAIRFEFWRRGVGFKPPDFKFSLIDHICYYVRGIFIEGLTTLKLFNYYIVMYFHLYRNSKSGLFIA